MEDINEVNRLMEIEIERLEEIKVQKIKEINDKYTADINSLKIAISANKRENKILYKLTL